MDFRKSLSISVRGKKCPLYLFYSSLLMKEIVPCFLYVSQWYYYYYYYYDFLGINSNVIYLCVFGRGPNNSFAFFFFFF